MEKLGGSMVNSLDELGLVHAPLQPFAQSLDHDGQRAAEEERELCGREPGFFLKQVA